MASNHDKMIPDMKRMIYAICYIAAKYEETYSPSSKKLLKGTNFSLRSIKKAELFVLYDLDFKLHTLTTW
jgi:hypothetical protein